MGANAKKLSSTSTKSHYTELLERLKSGSNEEVNIHYQEWYE
jgi:hypothetical protein